MSALRPAGAHKLATRGCPRQATGGKEQMLSLRTRSGEPLVALSTASVFPDRVADAFEIAARLGYDGLEVMVSADAVSQDVVVHPPFRWQRDYARDFSAGLARMTEESDIVFAVENMYPLRAGGAEVAAYAPHWNPLLMDSPHVTLDLSHTATSGSDAFAMAEQLGDRLAHVHMADGTGVPNRDEHLVPGRGTQPCAPLLEKLAADGYPGMVVLEVNTRRATTREARIGDLTEALDFTRRHLAATPAVTRSRPPA